MFMCHQTLEQFEDNQLAYTLIAENRLNTPAKDLFVMKFSSKVAVQDFLTRISSQRQNYVLTKVSKGGGKEFAPAYPKDLLLLVGSSKGN